MGQPIRCPGCGTQDKFPIVDTVNEFTLLLCPHCDLEFSNPMITPGGEWYDSTYIVRHSIINTAIQEYYKWTVASLPTRGNLLDVGCGEGVFVHYAREKGFNAFGIDFSQESIEAGKRLYELDTIYNCTLQDVPIKTGIAQFDVITCFEVLEHLDDPAGFLLNISKLLKKDGHLVVSVPYRDKWPVKEFNDYPPHHLTRWSTRSLSSFFMLNDYSIVQMRLGSRFHSYKTFIGYLLRILLYKMMGMYSKGLTIKHPASLKSNQFLKNTTVRLILSKLRPRFIRDILVLPFVMLSYPFVFSWFNGYNVMLIAQQQKNKNQALNHRAERY
jgi:SAM-dependent methyltransferase